MRLASASARSRMPRSASAARARSRSTARGAANGPRCAVRPISTRSSTRVGELHRLGLRDIGDRARHLGARQVLDRLSAEPDLAAARGDQAEQRLEQRRLAGAVRAQQAQHLAARQREVDAGRDEARAVADRQRARFEHRQLHIRRPRASSQTKTGAPRIAVSRPSGISMRAAVRATVSISTRNARRPSAARPAARGRSAARPAAAPCAA